MVSLTKCLISTSLGPPATLGSALMQSVGVAPGSRLHASGAPGDPKVSCWPETAVMVRRQDVGIPFGGTVGKFPDSTSTRSPIAQPASGPATVAVPAVYAVMVALSGCAAITLK